MEKKCTVIKVCYNSAATIRKTFESILKQTYPNIEYIVVDGQSTDGTIDIIKEFVPLFGERMKWISEPDDGIYDAMNKGIRMASGELIGILNSDDYYELDAVEHMVGAMTDEPYQILYGAMRIWKDGMERSISIGSHLFLREGMIGHPSCFVSKQLYMDLGGYDTQFVSAADYDFMLRMAENKEVYFKPVYKLIANFATGGMCSSSVAYYDLLKVQKKHGIITEKEYKKTVLKCKIHDFMRGIK